MKTKPNAKPPTTTCQRKVKLNIGLVSEPIMLNKELANRVPRRTPKTILHEATLVHNNKRSPNRINSVEVPPEEPGMLPTKASIQESLD